MAETGRGGETNGRFGLVRGVRKVSRSRRKFRKATWREEGVSGSQGDLLIFGSRELSAARRPGRTTNVFISPPLHSATPAPTPLAVERKPSLPFGRVVAHASPKSSFMPRAFTRAKGCRPQWIRTPGRVVGPSSWDRSLPVISELNASALRVASDSAAAKAALWFKQLAGKFRVVRGGRWEGRSGRIYATPRANARYNPRPAGNNRFHRRQLARTCGRFNLLSLENR